MLCAVEELEKAGELDNTYIIYTADNGEPLRAAPENIFILGFTVCLGSTLPGVEPYRQARWSPGTADSHARVSACRLPPGRSQAGRRQRDTLSGGPASAFPHQVGAPPAAYALASFLRHELLYCKTVGIPYLAWNWYAETLLRESTCCFTPSPPPLYNPPRLHRGPGIKAGEVLQTPTAHEDITPTILTLAGIDLPQELDGQPLPLPITPSAGYKQPNNKFEQ